MSDWFDNLNAEAEKRLDQGKPQSKPKMTPATLKCLDASRELLLASATIRDIKSHCLKTVGICPSDATVMRMRRELGVLVTRKPSRFADKYADRNPFTAAEKAICAQLQRLNTMWRPTA